MVVFLQYAIAALICLVVFSIIFVAGTCLGYYSVMAQINNPKSVRSRLEREFEVKD